MASAPICARNLPGIILLQFAVLFLREHFAFLDPRHFAGIDDDVAFEIKNALEIAHGNVQQVSDARSAGP